MTIKEQIVDVLGSGPKKLIDLVKILEEFGEYERRWGSVNPVKLEILRMLNSGELELSADRYLTLP